MEKAGMDEEDVQMAATTMLAVAIGGRPLR